jgi:hypothetical protein
MEQLIFFAVIIFFSIIESIARSRKAKMGGQLPEAPPEQEEPSQQPRTRPRQRPRPIPSYDTDPSFDAEPSLDSRGSYDDAKARESLEKRRSRSSESMIPAELWDEIAGLAREPERQEPTYTPPPRQQPRPAPQPQAKRLPTPRRPPAPQKSRAPAKRQPPPAPRRATILAPEPAPEGVAAHAVHESHAGFGTDPSSRPRSAQDGLDPLARVMGRDASAVHAQLVGSAHALRQAVIMYEVLGPPVSDRPDRF